MYLCGRLLGAKTLPLLLCLHYWEFLSVVDVDLDAALSSELDEALPSSITRFL